MTTVDALHLAARLVDGGDYERATDLLTKMPPLGNPALEIERAFLTAQAASRMGDIDTAVKIYQKILDANPNLARVRFELAICYMHQKKWRRADYHLRLAMAGTDLPDNARQMMNYYRYIIRQNKNWNVWFNIGAAPESNINNATGGTECVATMFGLMCRELGQTRKCPGRQFNPGREL